MNERDQFLRKVKQILNPALAAEGFRASGNTFRRTRGKIVNVVTLQGSRYGGQCCVCLGIHLTFLPMAGSGNACDSAKITEPECEFRSRLVPKGQVDYWWRYGDTEQEAQASVESILGLFREVGFPYFQRFALFPDDFVRTTPSMFAAGASLPFSKHTTSVCSALALSRIALHIGRTEDAKEFAKIGLARTGQAKGLISEFQKIISAE